MSVAIPSIDLGPWFQGDAADRQGVADGFDTALQRSGFLLITGHGIPPEAARTTRRLARAFFALPTEVKSRHAVSLLGGRGWVPSGMEANAYSEGTATPPDLKESLRYGADRATGEEEVDRVWYRPNPWPEEIPGLAEALRDYIARMHRLSDRLMGLCAVALGLAEDFFVAATNHPTYTLDVNWYPPMTRVGAPAAGQFRIGPHTDFGTLTLLDREPGAGGLQVYTQDEEWVDAPYHPGALTMNIGDLLARWTGDRWISARNRVLPPQESAPDEDLVSLIFYYETNHDALIESMPPPVGYKRYTPVYAADYLMEKYRAISVGWLSVE